PALPPRHTITDRSAPGAARRTSSVPGTRRQIPPSPARACADGRTRTAHSATGGAAFRLARRRVFAPPGAARHPPGGALTHTTLPRPPPAKKVTEAGSTSIHAA